MENLQRRTVMGLAVGAVAGSGLLAGCGDDEPGATPSGTASATSGVQPVGLRQEGVDTPVPRQRYVAVRVLDLADPAQAQQVLAAFGKAVDAVQRVDGLTLTVGVAPKVVQDAKGTGFLGTDRLPKFAKDQIQGGANGGDVLVQVCGDRRQTVGDAAAAVVQAVPGLQLRWGIDGFRGEVDGRGARNILGFYDGISVPTTPAELQEDVWTEDADGLADATICVVRRIRLDHRGFAKLSVQQQEDTIGRKKASGTPLSGGTITTDVDLDAHDASGVYDIPVDAHVRRAHPLINGAGKLMLRRSYSYRVSPDDQGLAFICFQRDLQQFVKTQYSIDDLDALMKFATVTGSGTFLILPRWSDDAPLGSALYA